MESKNALWRRENQLRCWDSSETNSASSTPRDRQLSAVKFHDDCVFLAACSSGDTKEVTWLLGRGADINTANVDGLTALHQVSPHTEVDTPKSSQVNEFHASRLNIGVVPIRKSCPSK